AGVPVRNAVGGGRAVDVVVARRPRGLDEDLVGRLARLEELDLLREAEHRPREAARPRRERRVALLAAGAPIRPARDVEEAFLTHPSGHVVDVASSTVKD